MKKFSFIYAGSTDFSLNCLKILIKNPQLELKAVISQPEQKRGRGLKKKKSALTNFANLKNIPLLTPETCQSIDFLNEIKKKIVTSPLFALTDKFYPSIT